MPFQSTARKCSLPVRILDPSTETVQTDSLPKEVSDEKVEELALRAFFYDYCIVSVNKYLSRGYLDSLEQTLYYRGMHSDLAKACKAVAFADHGNKLRRRCLSRKAAILYSELLGSLARAIAAPSVEVTSESLGIAVLLGLYEVIQRWLSITTVHG